jgi:hypothetical protein
MNTSCLLVLAALVLAALPATATLHTLDDPASPISVTFDTNGGRLTVTNKLDGFVWRNTTSGGGDTMTVGAVTQPDATHLTAALTHASSGAALTLALELVPATGDLRVALAGVNAAIPNGVQYPYAFHPVGQGNNGFAVLPYDSGFVLPESQTSWTTKFNPLAHRRMEWFGGTDRNNARGWIGIVETHADFELRTATGAHEGFTVIGGVPKWVGSNDNPAHTPNLFSYDRVVRFRFLSSGGYVALAKQFRAWAQTQGWVKTLAAKNAEAPERKTERFIGAPVIYLWGDGRDEPLIDSLYDAGLRKAVLQISVNHLDQNKNFPNTAHANGSGWMDAAKARGVLPGFYDIYAAMRVGGSAPSSPYDGNYYLWPTNQAAAWAYYDAAGKPLSNSLGSVISYDISAAMQAQFAAATRLPAHLAQFGVDAYFFDTTCAGPPREDYDTNYNHFATRAMDISNRVALLNTAFANPAKRLLTGTEQGRSWAVPVLHWAEGKFWLGEPGNLVTSDSGAWNDASYPQIMADVVDPTTLDTNKLAPLLSHGWQAPLWDLVFHDCMVNTVHWSRPHNKFLYAWDHADLWAMLRGQAPLLNLTRSGVQGAASRAPNTVTDVFGNPWSSRWTTMSNRFVQTFTNVCAWHERVGWLEMIDHRRLTADASVQMSEFSADGGASGRGIVVNFGVFDGAYAVTNATWSGTVRGKTLSVPAGRFQTYAWSELKLTGAGVSTNGVPQFTFSAISRQSYVIETSTNLAAWSPWQTNTATNATLIFSDPSATNHNQKFFRVREQ